MSEETAQKLARLAELASTPERRVSPMQITAQLLEDAMEQSPVLEGLPEKLLEAVELHPGPADEEDLLGWDVWLESPPPRPERTITVTLEYLGRDTPLSVQDPPDE